MPRKEQPNEENAARCGGPPVGRPARGHDGKFSIYPITSAPSGGEPRPVPGLTEADVLAQWSADCRSVLVYRRAEIPCRLERVDLATGRRTLFKELAPADRTGLLSIREIFVTDDLRSTAYTAYYQVASLLCRKAGNNTTRAPVEPRFAPSEEFA